MLNAVNLPERVIEALGAEAARDFTDWFEGQIHAAQGSLVQVSAFVARQKVNVLMLERVSNLLLAGEPYLERRSDAQWMWRVPVHLTLPGHGRLGQVGDVEVDAVFGQVQAEDDLLSAIAVAAEQLFTQVVPRSSRNAITRNRSSIPRHCEIG